MAKPGEIGSLMARNSPQGTKLSIKDNYRQWLIFKGASGSSGSNLRALEKSFFAANGGSGKTYNELKGSFLGAKGYTGGLSVEDNWRRFCAGGAV